MKLTEFVELSPLNCLFFMSGIDLASGSAVSSARSGGSVSADNHGSISVHKKMLQSNFTQEQWRRNQQPPKMPRSKSAASVKSNTVVLSKTRISFEAPIDLEDLTFDEEETGKAARLKRRRWRHLISSTPSEKPRS